MSGCHNLWRCGQRIQQSWKQCLKLLFMRRQGLTFVLAIRHILWSYFVLKDVGKSKGNRQYLGFSAIPCHPKSLQVSLQALCRPCAAWQNCSTGFMSIEIPIALKSIEIHCVSVCFCHLFMWRQLEWWLFKVVWAFSTGIFGLLAAVPIPTVGVFPLEKPCMLPLLTTTSS